MDLSMDMFGARVPKSTGSTRVAVWNIDLATEGLFNFIWEDDYEIAMSITAVREMADVIYDTILACRLFDVNLPVWKKKAMNAISVVREILGLGLVVDARDGYESEQEYKDLILSEYKDKTLTVLNTTEDWAMHQAITATYTDGWTCQTRV